MKTKLMLVAALIVMLSGEFAMAEERGNIHDGVTWLRSARQADAAALNPIEDMPPLSHNDDLVVLYRQLHYQLSESTVIRSSTRIYRYNSQEAVRDYGTLSTSFDAAKQEIEIVHAMIVDSSGAMHVVDPATVQVVPSDSYGIFSDVKNIMLPMHGVDSGSIAVLSDIITTDRKSDIAPWGLVTREQYGVPQGKVEVLISWDEAEFRPEWNSEIEGMKCTESSARSLHCEVVDVPAYAFDDDVYMDDEVPYFSAAEAASWQDVADWYGALFSSALSDDSSIAAKSAQLSEGLDDETEVLKSIHEFVSNQVRYVGLEHGDSAYRPHATELTLQRRYGDCKDKAALMIDLLHHAGIEMSPVLVATTRRDPDKLVTPTVRYFDHLIVCGELANGQHYCLDGTDPYTGISQVSDWIQGAVALKVGDNAVPITLPFDTHRFSMNENLRLEFNAAGELKEEGDVNYEGSYGANIRGYLAGLTNAERREWALEDYHDTVSTLTDPDFRIDGVEAANDELTIGWEANFERIVDPDGDFDYLENAAWLDQMIGYIQTENDAYAYRFPGLRFDSIVTTDVAEKWAIKQWSPDIDMQSRFGRFERSIELQDQQLVIHTKFEAPAAVIVLDDIDDFNQFLKIVLAENSWSAFGPLQ